LPFHCTTRVRISAIFIRGPRAALACRFGAVVSPMTGWMIDALKDAAIRVPMMPVHAKKTSRWTGKSSNFADWSKPIGWSLLQKTRPTWSGSRSAQDGRGLRRMCAPAFGLPTTAHDRIFDIRTRLRIDAGRMAAHDFGRAHRAARGAFRPLQQCLTLSEDCRRAKWPRRTRRPRTQRTRPT
jgi:hypothetical protein